MPRPLQLVKTKCGSVRNVFVVLVVTVFIVREQSSNYNQNDDTEFTILTTECNLDAINSPLTAQNDPCLIYISIIRQKYLIPPSPRPLNLSNPTVKNPSYGQSQKVLRLLRNKRRGFFIEAGALDGESYSNSIYMERKLGWRGLLVEPNPASFKKLVARNRKAWLVPVALSNSPYPKVVTFNQQWTPDVSQIDEFQKAGSRPGLISVQCFPIYSILLALNRTAVDFFSLDVEGFELEVLRTIPWKKVDIKTLAVEFSHVKEGKEAVKCFMEENGYSVKGEVIIEGSLMAYDMIFVKNSSYPPVLS